MIGLARENIVAPLSLIWAERRHGRGRIGGGGASDAGGLFVIDLAAIKANYIFVAARVAPSRVAGVVKADAYGLGADRVTRAALAEEGCRDFFVAHLSGALDLKSSLPLDARLYVLNGLAPGVKDQCAAAGVLPVLNSSEQAVAWHNLAAS